MAVKDKCLGVIDYGTGNLRSVVKALEYLGSKVHILQNPDGLNSIDALVFPGQGSFDQCMKALEQRGFDNAIKEWISNDNPFLGVCLGLQILFERSEEGKKSGLGLFPGFVQKFSVPHQFKIPHMGWNSVYWGKLKNGPMQTGLMDGDQFYFVHSYHIVAGDDSLRTLSTTYDYSFISGICHGNCFATQFHPEKSQAKGLQIYQNFLEKIVV